MRLPFGGGMTLLAIFVGVRAFAEISLMLLDPPDDATALRFLIPIFGIPAIGAWVAARAWREQRWRTAVFGLLPVVLAPWLVPFMAPLVIVPLVLLIKAARRDRAIRRGEAVLSGA